jgi:hypothetical protein
MVVLFSARRTHNSITVHIGVRHPGAQSEATDRTARVQVQH